MEVISQAVGLFSTARIDCPCCGERIELNMDTSVGSQDCIEDCQVCCRPIPLRLTVAEDGAFQIEARRDDE